MIADFLFTTAFVLLVVYPQVPKLGFAADASLRTFIQTYGRNTKWRSTPFPGHRMKILPWRNP